MYVLNNMHLLSDVTIPSCKKTKKKQSGNISRIEMACDLISKKTGMSVRNFHPTVI